MPITSDPIAMARAYATDDAARYARLLDLTRSLGVSIEEMDERDEQGRVQVRLYAPDEEHMTHAIEELEKEHSE